MFFINIADPWAILIAIFAIICFIYIGREAKNAYVPLTTLIVFLIMLLMHGIQLIFLPEQYAQISTQLSRCLVIDFVMIFITYVSYLWIDDIETKAKKKKSIDNSLDWFWKNV